MTPNTSGGKIPQTGFEKLESRGKIRRYSDSYAIVLYDVPPTYIGRLVASFEFTCCGTRYVYNSDLNPSKWIRIIAFKRLRLDGVSATPAIRVPLSAAIKAFDALLYLYSMKEWTTVKLLVVLP